MHYFYSSMNQTFLYILIYYCSSIFKQDFSSFSIFQFPYQFLSCTSTILLYSPLLHFDSQIVYVSCLSYNLINASGLARSYLLLYFISKSNSCIDTRNCFSRPTYLKAQQDVRRDETGWGNEKDILKTGDPIQKAPGSRPFNKLFDKAVLCQYQSCFKNIYNCFYSNIHIGHMLPDIFLWADAYMFRIGISI